MVESIAKTLGTGSGIDTAGLVDSLVDAQFSYKNQSYDKKAETLTAQISAVSDLKNTISDFANALQNLVKGGTLQTQPTTSNADAVKVTGLSGAKLTGLSASVAVDQLATAQTAHSGAIADRSAAMGTGTLTLTLGNATVSNGAMTDFTAGSATPVSITIDSTNNSLDGIAAAINRANAGVTASILSDGQGARLVLKGATGAAQGFTLSAQSDSGDLSAIAVGPGAGATTIGAAAQDAKLTVDGVALTRPTNSIDDLISGVRIDLLQPTTGNPVSIGASPATAALKHAVNDYVDTYNQLIAMVGKDIDAKTGALRSDPAAQALGRQLGALTLTNIVNDGPAGSPQTLAEIGVATNRDGSLRVVDSDLDAAINQWPQVVEKMFSPGLLSQGDGLSAALNSIATKATSSLTGLGASAIRYGEAQSDLSDLKDKASSDANAMRTRLTQQFASMDSKVAAYKSTQTFLEQQIASWNAKS